MEESLAPKAEISYNRNAKEAYVKVRVQNGMALIEELYVDNLPIREFVLQAEY